MRLAHSKGPHKISVFHEEMKRSRRQEEERRRRRLKCRKFRWRE
jgi:hypothetical protein